MEFVGEVAVEYLLTMNVHCWVSLWEADQIDHDNVLTLQQLSRVREGLHELGRCFPLQVGDMVDIQSTFRQRYNQDSCSINSTYQVLSIRTNEQVTYQMSLCWPQWSCVATSGDI